MQPQATKFTKNTNKRTLDYLDTIIWDELELHVQKPLPIEPRPFKHQPLNGQTSLF